ncbi:MAG: hypothetical protein IIV57_03090 [Bacteroidaceae bacterium]|jgi:hypothetical protein|nr:hypothetical protein [Bacteroidaceae bacterium]
MGNSSSKSVREMRKEAVVKTFFETVKQLKSKDKNVTQEEIFNNASKCAAPRFFVTFEIARRLISSMVKNRRLPIKNKNKIEMYKELYRRYMKQNKGNVGNYTILESIIEEPAPSFYLDAGSFRGIVYRTLGERSLQIV